MEDESLKEAFSKELEIFLAISQDCLRRVLVFPCINSYSRLRLHEVTKEKYLDLASFSVGVEPDRRPVICRQQLLIENVLSNPFPLPTLPSPQQSGQPTIVVPPTKQPIAQSETGNGNRKKRPGKALYVPKALRDRPKPSGGTEESVVPHVAVAEVVPKMKTWQDEIESQTGPIQIVEPLTDFILFETGCYTSKDKAFRRVVELGDFPKELKTSDLESVLHTGLVKIKDYYDLRWVDDTHAIVIFSDEVTAAKSLTIKDTQIKFKPFYQACEASKSKAKGFNIDIESGSVRSRPDTTTVIAKRLLSRALNNPEIQASPQDVNLLQQAKTYKSTNDSKE